MPNLNRCVHLVRSGLSSLKHNGIKNTAERVKYSLNRAKRYRRLGKSLFDPAAEQARREKPVNGPLISIAVPLYNTPERFLKEMAESVLRQTCPNWELCLADGSDDSHGSVEAYCRSLAEKDPRVKYRRLAENYGIAGNSNAALEMAQGEYIALLDHDDILHPAAIYRMAERIKETRADFLYSDECTFSGKAEHIISVHFKPDYAPDSLCSSNYICHLSVFSRTLYEKAGGFRPGFDGAQDHDLILRLTEKAERIVHIPEILYLWRAHAGSVAGNINSKSYAAGAGCRAVSARLERLGRPGQTESSTVFPFIYRVRYELKDTPKISVLIPTKDHADVLRRCVRSVLEKTDYPNYEILIIDNGSSEKSAEEYCNELRQEPRVRILHRDIPFNFSSLNNFAAGEAEGSVLVLLNNDTEVITPGWLEEMLMFAQRDDVGAVGARLLYPNGMIQHAGLVCGLGKSRTAGHVCAGSDPRNPGYMGWAHFARNVSAVTGACLMVRRDLWEQAGGMDENLAVSLNDADLCLRLLAMGKVNVYTPFAQLYHHESLSRGGDENPENAARFRREADIFRTRHRALLEQGDPYYNPNLTLDHPDCSPR